MELADVYFISGHELHSSGLTVQNDNGRKKMLTYVRSLMFSPS